jgi:predicted RNase H-like nuclease
MLVAGVDGCRSGWVVVRAEVAGRLFIESVLYAASFAEMLELTDGCGAVGVDVPIGLMDDTSRHPDSEARRRLQPYRGASVFPAPVRAVLGCETYLEACEASYAASGKRISKQLWMIVPKIREADACMTPRLQQRVVEVHPEVCFWALNGGAPLPLSKHTIEGLEMRAQLLSGRYAGDIRRIAYPSLATRDDFYDACAAAWTAARVAKGTAQRLPSEPAFDARGLRMEIVY